MAVKTGQYKVPSQMTTSQVKPNSRWLSHVKEALNAACLAAQCLEKEDAPVMVVEQVDWFENTLVILVVLLGFANFYLIRKAGTWHFLSLPLPSSFLTPMQEPCMALRL